MPRYQRTFLVGFPHHIVQRGHDRKAIFACDDDYLEYLDNLSEQLLVRKIKIYAYCLMTNHVHLLLEPTAQADSISDLMRVVAARQTRYINRLEQRSGTLWEGRFKCSLVEREVYLATCIQYIEMNPVKAGIVEMPVEYRWSSYRQRVGGCETGISLGALTAPEFQASYQVLNEDNHSAFTTKHVDDFIRAAVSRNQLTGTPRFRNDIEQKLGRRLSDKAPGRPKNQIRKK